MSPRTLLALVVPIALSGHSATIINGGNITTTTWTLANSPYVVQGDVVVPAGSTLTIQPGVEVHVSPFDAQASGLDSGRVEFTINGTILVVGTEASPAVFRAQSGSGPSVWYGIVASPATDEAVRCDYMDIRNAWIGVRVLRGLAQLRGGTISFCDTGIDANGGTAALNRSLLLSNRVAVTHIGSPGQAVVIARSIITGSEIAFDIRDEGLLNLSFSTVATNQTGFLISNLAHANLFSTSIGRCATGILVSDAAAEIRCCRIFGNGSGVVGEASSTIRILSSVFHHNTNAITTAGVGAVTNCTLHANGSAIQISGSSQKSLVNSLISSNGVGIVASGAFNPFYMGSVIFWGNATNQVGLALPAPLRVADPQYSNIAGPDEIVGTMDDRFAVSPGSPVVDAGESTLPDPDFAELPRMVDYPDQPDTGPGPPPVIDIGAYELQPAPRFTNIGITNGVVFLSFKTSLGKFYDLQHSPPAQTFPAFALWVTATNVGAGNGTVMTVPRVISTNSAQQFYRVRETTFP